MLIFNLADRVKFINFDLLYITREKRFNFFFLVLKGSQSRHSAVAIIRKGHLPNDKAECTSLV